MGRSTLIRLFAALFDTRNAALFFAAAILGFYGILPIVVHWLALPNPYFVDLAALGTVAAFFIYIGHALPLFDHAFRPRALRIRIDPGVFHVVVWSAFVIFLIVTFATAQSVPLFSALRGAEAYELSQQRGEFLKGRVGAEVVLLYLSATFISSLLPYSLARMFIDKTRYRYWVMLLFLVFSVSFLVRSMFVNVLLPLFYVAVLERKASGSRVVGLIGAAFILLWVVTTLSTGMQTQFAEGSGDANFFEAGYAPNNIGDLLLWRSTAVPMFAASDTLLVFHELIGGRHLSGATSSFLSSIFSMERVNVEVLVHAYQWGLNEHGNSNAVFFTEAYVNFGAVGVGLYALFVGQSLRWFRKSQDEALRALWPVYCYLLFSGGLIPLLLSNGYLPLFFLAFFVKLERKAPAVVPRAEPRSSFS